MELRQNNVSKISGVKWANVTSSADESLLDGVVLFMMLALNEYGENANKPTTKG
ncbi:hypothetical protein V7075_11460 [Neobacillus drentensis]|uniref:hypothetical protein n=1 Tax=Neobacillus drentensis TaxID=220684 RepID=UPI002FFD5CF1